MPSIAIQFAQGGKMHVFQKTDVMIKMQRNAQIIERKDLIVKSRNLKATHVQNKLLG